MVVTLRYGHCISDISLIRICSCTNISLCPKFLVFYNGTEEMEDSRTEYLSAAFENLTGEPDLELKVLTLNINIGHNQELLEQRRALKE